MSQQILEVGRVWLGSDKEEAVKGGKTPISPIKTQFTPIKN